MPWLIMVGVFALWTLSALFLAREVGVWLALSCWSGPLCWSRAPWPQQGEGGGEMARLTHRCRCKHIREYHAMDTIDRRCLICRCGAFEKSRGRSLLITTWGPDGQPDPVVTLPGSETDGIGKACDCLGCMDGYTMLITADTQRGEGHGSAI